jgi:TRAP-type C4-dicarboxylate transport system permease small subunit
MKTILKKINKPIVMLISALGILFFLTVIVSVVMQIVFRFVLRISVPWTEELARLAVIWMTFFGIILVQADRESIRTDFFINKLPLKMRSVLEKIVNLVSIVLLLVILRGAIEMLPHASGVTMSSIVWLRSTVLYYPVIIAIPFLVAYLIRDLFIPTPETRKEN